ncbi:MAG TPA: TIGR04282 family arsenosugar biosynthesis glycosyltransferase [Candidatus Binatia bacterium]
MPTHGNALAIMTKAPVPGETKTRLAPPLSFEEAAELSEALIRDQLQHLRDFTRAELFLAYTPFEAADYFATLHPRDFSFVQRGTDLGDRMRNAFEELFSRSFHRVVLIGGDLPAIPLKNIFDAFEFLADDSSEVVLGPAMDGGYYLVGMNRLTEEIFSGIQWSRSDVLESTIRNLKSLNIRYKLVSSWYDVDTFDDLRRVEAEFAPVPAAAMNLTLRLLKKFREGGKLS